VHTDSSHTRTHPRTLILAPTCRRSCSDSASVIAGSRWHVPPCRYLTSAYPLGMVAALAVWPRLSDHIGRRPVLAVSLAGVGLGFIAQVGIHLGHIPRWWLCYTYVTLRWGCITLVSLSTVDVGLHLSCTFHIGRRGCTFSHFIMVAGFHLCHTPPWF
jgi:MFS family permease